MPAPSASRVRRPIAAGGLAGSIWVFLILTAGPVGAATINGSCSGAASSFAPGADPEDPTSLPIDSIEVPENSSVANGSEDDPFELDSRGTVAWQGQTSMQATNGSWSIDFPAGGAAGLGDSDDNADDSRSDAGVKDMSDVFAFDVTGLILVSGDYSADGGDCDGSGWIKLIGSPIATIPWIGGLVVAGIGLVGMGFATPRAVPAPSSMMVEMPDAPATGPAEPDPPGGPRVPEPFDPPVDPPDGAPT